MTVRVLRNQRPVILNIEREITVDERRPIGERIYVIDARDPDLLPGSALHYQVYGEGLAPGLFEIVDIEKGFITVASNLMRDKAPAYNLTVVVYDFGTARPDGFLHNQSQHDQNANAPVFTANPYRSNLEWRDLPVKIVATISATDADNDRVTYSLGSNLPEVADYFRVNSDNGNIVLLRDSPSAQRILHNQRSGS
ncbi:protocadherin beta-14-like [Dreissena polymorpha]|uniref:protocadherin beta-14-like n=1 Tax=Dreissena polymorpha TaxID=45954 RepID=UPI002264F1F6|nr:protocadherin beta-14-like [Dreissena polymorpha]